MARVLAAAFASLFLIGSGAVHGLMMDRWGRNPEPRASAARLEAVPRQVGDWTLRSEEKLNDQELAIGEIAGYVNRVYENKKTGLLVSFLIVCGRPGPMSVHPPEVCLKGAGWDLGRLTRRALKAAGLPEGSNCKIGDFRKAEGGNLSYQRVIWSWSANGKWEAPNNPRWRFAGQPALFKLYILRPVTLGDESLDNDACLAFAHEMLPELDKVLFSKS